MVNMRRHAIIRTKNELNRSLGSTTGKTGRGASAYILNHLVKPMLSSTLLRTATVAVASLFLGFQLGSSYQSFVQNSDRQNVLLPNGLPRTCCENEKSSKRPYELTKDQQELSTKLKKLLGKENVIDGRTETTETLRFLKGARLGHGRALCILTPERLQDVVDAVKLVVEAGCVVLPQGQNTGLTGGSVPAATDQTDDNRPVVVLSMRHFNRFFPLDKGQRVVCLAGTGLASLQQFLKKEFPHRESHSTLGSTFLDPTTAAGVAFGSGGTQVRKGPAYTDRVLYITVSPTKWGDPEVKIVNTLGIKGLDENAATRRLSSVPSVIDRWSRWVNGGHDRTMRYSSHEGQAAWAHDITYGQRLCSTDAISEVSRFNADTKGIFPNRSEGKVIILASVHDTFAAPNTARTFWISFDSLDTALDFRRQVCLHTAQDLPIILEYMDKDAFDVVNGAGRVLSNCIWLVGTSSSIVKHLWNVKLWIEALPLDGAALWVDRLLFFANSFMPAPLPSPVMKMANTFNHHVAVTVGDFGGGELDRFIDRMEKFEHKRGKETMQIYEPVRSSEANSISAFRFAAAPAFRTYCVGKHLQGVSVDYALPKLGGRVPPLSTTDDAVSQDLLPVKRMRYSHFACNVVHEDLAYGPETDVHRAKYLLKHAVETEGGQLPSEHGHGREYTAPPETQSRWQKMDPLNVFNPGIGGLSYRPKYGRD